MIGGSAWTAKSELVHNGQRYELYRGNEPVSFRAYVDALADDAGFAQWYSELLRGSDCEAFFWEHPPLRRSNMESQAEFVLIDSPALAGLGPDAKSFRSYFRGEGDIVSFPSLGGDAVLIAPAPSEPVAACAHLAAFLRHAPAAQVAALWHATGRAVRGALSDRNLWLSTSGLGVSWLHIRLDSFPKYYQHGPYRGTRGTFRLR